MFRGLKTYLGKITAIVIFVTAVFSNTMGVYADDGNYDTYTIKIGKGNTTGNTVTFNIGQNDFNVSSLKGITSLTENGALIPFIEENHSSVLENLSFEDFSIEAVNTQNEAAAKSYDRETKTFVFSVGEKEYSIELFDYGDVDFNTFRNVDDSLNIIRALNGGSLLSEKQKAAADVNADHKVSAKDAVSIVHHQNGDISSFPAESSDISDNIIENDGPQTGNIADCYYIDAEGRETKCESNSIPLGGVVVEAVPSKSDLLIGEEFYIDFKIKNNPGFFGYGFTLEYDPEAIEAVYYDEYKDMELIDELDRKADVKYANKGKKLPAVSYWDINSYVQRIENGRVSFANLVNNALCLGQGDGIMFRMPFKAKAAGPAKILLHSYNGDMLIDRNAQTIPCYMRSGSVSVREPIPAAGITLDKTEADVIKREKITLKASVVPENADNVNIVWSSGNPEIASVDDSGNVTGITEGTAVITAKTSGGDYSASCNVTVKGRDKLYYAEDLKISAVDSIPNDAVSIEVVPLKSSVAVGEEFYVDFVIKNNPGFYGYSIRLDYNPSVVLPVKLEGDELNEIKETAEVKYTYEGVSLPAFDVNLINDRIKGEETGYITFAELVNQGRSPGSGDGIMFRMKFKAVKEGTTGIEIGDIYGSFLVSGNANNIPLYVQNGKIEAKKIVVTDITLNKTEEEMPIGTFLTLETSLYPANAPKENIIWKSSDPSVASVCQDGIVLAHKSGNAVITAATESGKASAQCEITVTAASPPAGYKHGDVDGDGKLTANDASVLLQKVLNGMFKMPVENLWK